VAHQETADKEVKVETADKEAKVETADKEAKVETAVKVDRVVQEAREVKVGRVAAEATADRVSKEALALPPAERVAPVQAVAPAALVAEAQTWEAKDLGQGPVQVWPRSRPAPYQPRTQLPATQVLTPIQPLLLGTLALGCLFCSYLLPF
jgi:hypothetical protein